MIKSIITFSATNRFLVLSLVSVLTAVGWWCLQRVTLDAIPDLSDTQVIVYSRWDRSPDIIEDQVTYPIITALLGAPRVKSIRGFSDFGFSYVYIIFEDGADIYWARSRTLEYLSKITPSLPDGVKTELGPDATGVGWVYQYALKDTDGTTGLDGLRALNDWNLRYRLQSVPGVSEVASVGGYVRQYQVQLDPDRLLAYGIPLNVVSDAIRKSNNDTGGRLIEFSGREYMVRGIGYIRTIADVENIVVSYDPATGAPVLVRHIAKVQFGPDMRRGIADLNGEGETVGGIVVMRHGENAVDVIARVKKRLDEIKPSLPDGVEIVATYDRSVLIHDAVATLKDTLIDEMIIVSLVILLFLWHVPSAIVPIITIPVSVIVSFIPFYLMGFSANIMSLAGIAISIGVLVDGAIVEVENAYKKLEKWIEGGRQGDFHAVRLEALTEVGPAVFFSLLVIAVSFLPVFTLVDQEGRLFKPLATSKNLAMLIAAILAVTLDPALRMLFTRMEPFKLRWRSLSRVANAVLVGKYYPEERHPVSRILFALYEPVCRLVLRRKKTTLAIAVLLMLSAIPAYFDLGSEFMPPLNEGTLLYMPTTLPGISVAEAGRILQKQDELLRGFPEVESVFGKAGRAETATDPAPFSMVETTIVLKPRHEWRKVERWYSGLPEFLHPLLRPLWDDRLRWDDLVDEMDAKLKIAGWSSRAFVMPIKTRIDMLTTGIRSPVGVKISGPDLKIIEGLSVQVEEILKTVPGTRSAFAERVTQGYFVDFTLNRLELALHGITVDDANAIISGAIGGEVVTTTIEGRERYGVSVRLKRERRDDIEDLKRVMVAIPSGAQIPLGLMADIALKTGPAMIRDEDGLLTGYVFIYLDEKSRDLGGYVESAKAAVDKALPLPAGYTLRFSGQYENMLRVRERLKLVVPVTLILIVFLLYLNTKSWVKTLIILTAVPFSLIGAVWLLWFLDYHVSIAVGVGMIALMGLDAETGVFMLLYLDMAYDEAVKNGRMQSRADLNAAIMHGAVKRIRPKMMTVMAAFIGLMPIMGSLGTGADMMKRVAAPMVGGLVTSFALELIVYPVLYALWRGRSVAESTVQS